MKKAFLSLMILGLFSCKNDATEISKTNTTIEVEIDKESVVDTEIETENVESKYHYDQDWELFKTAILTRDIKGISAFASSDNIDSEALLNSISDESFLKILNTTTYNDLTVEEQGDYTFLVFKAETKETDNDGNEFESGIYIYFTQGETSLLLDYYLVAG